MAPEPSSDQHLLPRTSHPLLKVRGPEAQPHPANRNSAQVTQQAAAAAQGGHHGHRSAKQERLGNAQRLAEGRQPWLPGPGSEEQKVATWSRPSSVGSYITKRTGTPEMGREAPVGQLRLGEGEAGIGCRDHRGHGQTSRRCPVVRLCPQESPTWRPPVHRHASGPGPFSGLDTHSPTPSSHPRGSAPDGRRPAPGHTQSTTPSHGPSTVVSGRRSLSQNEIPKSKAPHSDTFKNNIYTVDH